MHAIRNSALLASAGLAIVLGAATARAQDGAQNSDWRDHTYNGPYVSGTVGVTAQANKENNALVFDRDNNGSFGDTVTTASGANAFSPGFCSGYYRSTTPRDCKGDRNRPDYAVRLGVDKRFGHWVAGGLLEGSINKSRDATSAFDTAGNAYRISRGIDYGFAARGRVGWTPNGGGLFYGTGGIGYARMKHILRTTDTANTFVENHPNDWRWGWQAGGGAEVMVTPKLSLGLEYLYNHYRDKNYSVAITQGSAPSTNQFLLAGGQTNMKVNGPDYEYHTLRATLSYHF